MANTPKRPFLLLSALLLTLSPPATPQATQETSAPAPTQIPDLTWSPVPFNSNLQEPVRYIDYRNGKDSNPGTRNQPWQHHPWDDNAEGRATATQGVVTYVFKRGVVYRGQLKARESGTTQRPIRLTVDPTWGDGEAILTGADALQAQWRPCTAKEATALPAPSRQTAFCAQTPDSKHLSRLWLTGESITPIHPARFPNWSPGVSTDQRAQWLEIDGAEMEMEIGLSSTAGIKPGDPLMPLQESPGAATLLKRTDNRFRWIVHHVARNQATVLTSDWPSGGLKNGTQLTNGAVTASVTRTSGTHSLIRRLYDKDILSKQDLGDLTGAVIRIEVPYTQQIATGIVLGNNSRHGFLRADLRLAPGQGPREYDRYYLEGLPRFLDQPGEFARTPDAHGRDLLYLRLPGDRDPNSVALEVPARSSIIEIEHQRHIEISGLAFRFTALPVPGTVEARNAALYSAAIQIRGNAAHINMHHCRFEHLESGIVAYPTGKRVGEVLDHLIVTDNEFSNIDGSAIILGSGQDRVGYSGKGRLIHATVLRNRVLSTGELPLTHWGQGALGHGIDITGAEVTEVAYNHVKDVGGAGINVYLGSASGKSGIPHPFLRGKIHHNKVSNSLLGVQDFGGIESWLGGPMYIYDNISINPLGYGHGLYKRNENRGSFRNGSYGVGIYLDGQYKSYVFNNIVWGYNNDVRSGRYNAAAFNEATGFLNTVFNNTFMRFGVGLHKGMDQHNRSYYLGNLLLDMGHSFILQEPRDKYIEYESLAYANNIFHGKPESFGQLGRKERPSHSLAEWRAFLGRKNVLASGTGTVSTSPVIRNTGALDFRLARDSLAIDNGVKVFVPWALARVVGEWHFYRSPAPDRVRDESLNMNATWVRRSMFQDIPRHDLKCPQTGKSDYVRGELENWIPGALSFDGRTQYCKIDNARLMAGFTWHDTETKESGSFNGSDRDTVDIGTESFLIEAVLATEPRASAFGILAKHLNRGYSLDVDQTGTLLLSLNNGTARFQAKSHARINDGNWHHIIVEVDRRQRNRITFYIDGKQDATVEASPAKIGYSLSNDGDFLVGRSAAGYFRGRLDFLRLSKGTLADAETTIQELYAWEFNGPHLHDFTGAAPAGTARDAGAVEYSQ
ncbi:MAG: LamG domain-containing protein [Sulfuricaulis sp.]|uniref:LamG-like jellyroll fold domain-containing protein n=1 Tax=Sulfuricaulis sp. TaxID=2003553 RepID=UPI0025FCDEA3|nr:LamG-like jellyroll fold domain-containing protein [Sulfuricaulis sp.]MCR4347312.1 LamG domain-containing protein [Sulfuricaulis sp.]